MNWIQHMEEPDRLLLAWQAPDHMKDRTRWAVGEVFRDLDDIVYREFHDKEFERHNDGKSRNLLDGLGYGGYPAFDTHKAEQRVGVMAALLRRLPPRSRPDFARYVAHFRIPADADVPPMTLLGLTEAKLPSDGFSLVNPQDPDVDQCEFVAEVAGHRHHRGPSDFCDSIGSQVDLVPEPDNPHDCNAVMVCWRGHLIGYINRLQAATFLRWIAERRVHAVVERLNGTIDKPRVFLFVSVRRRTEMAAA